MSEPQDPFAPPGGQPTAPPAQAGQPGWQAPGAGEGWQGGPTGWAPPKTNTKAIVALCLAISAYLPIVPFIGAVVALFVAGPAKREILASGGRESGLGLVTAARVLSIVHLVFVALLVAFVISAFALPFAFL